MHCDQQASSAAPTVRDNSLNSAKLSLPDAHGLPGLKPFLDGQWSTRFYQTMYPIQVVAQLLLIVNVERYRNPICL
jgi:hypothetical protein